MFDYKHYIRTNEAGIIIHGYSSVFEEPQEGDILIAENDIRHFHEFWPEPLTNDRQQYCFRWDGQLVPRAAEELDAEWSARPQPVTPEQRIEQLEQLVADLASLQLGV